MIAFNTRPFNYIPLNQGDIFDLTCEYMVSLLRKIDNQYHTLHQKLKQTIENIPAASFDVYAECFDLAEGMINDYSRLIKAAKLSLGQNVGKVKSKHAIFVEFSYKPHSSLQDTVVHGLRNTSQHFEERLQEFGNTLNFFLKLTYSAANLNWEIFFGDGGYKHNGSSTGTKENFNSANVYFHSYKRELEVLVPVRIAIDEVWRDTNEIYKLVRENIEHQINEKKVCCPAPRGVSVFIES